jgi:hypothetical protein
MLQDDTNVDTKFKKIWIFFWTYFFNSTYTRVYTIYAQLLSTLNMRTVFLLFLIDKKAAFSVSEFHPIYLQISTAGITNKALSVNYGEGNEKKTI